MFTLNYQLIRQKRKSLSLQVKHSQIIVKAPLNLDEEYINSWLKTKDSWIKKQQQKQLQHLQHQKNYQAQYIIGGYIPYMGSKIQLCLANEFNKNFTFDGNNLYVKQNFCNARHLQIWYKQQAKILYEQLLNYWQAKMQVKMQEFKLSYGLKRLGYCTNKGVIALSWYLILQPLYVIEYIIIHELTHLVHFNHSPAFWHMVKYYCPHYEKAKLYLQEKGFIYI